MKPNFFIIGAPKCGTTSLSNWLQEHPGVFLAPGKEIHYFSGLNKNIKTDEDYERIFGEVPDCRKIIIDASTSYFGSPIAISRIMHYAPNAKFVVLLRNPVDMCESVHGQLLWTGIEIEGDFENAWKKQKFRLENPGNARLENLHFRQYFERCRLGTFLSKALSQIPRDRLLVLFLEDMAENPRSVYQQVLGFAGLEDDGRDAFPWLNRYRQHRFPMMNRLLLLAMRGREALGIRHGFGVRRLMNRIARKEGARPPLCPEFEAELYDVFRPEVELLEELTGRDLSHWKQPPRRAATTE